MADDKGIYSLPPRRRLNRAACPGCRRQCDVETDGTFKTHRRSVPMPSRKCPGSGVPVGTTAAMLDDTPQPRADT